MVRTTITDPLKKKVVRYLEDHSQYATAKKFKIGIATVNRIAHQDPTAKPIPKRSDTKNAVRVHMTYAKDRRVKLLDKFLGKLEGMLDDPELRPGQMTGLAVALGTIFDKYRLEEGSSGDGKAALLTLAEEIRKNAEAAVNAGARST